MVGECGDGVGCEGGVLVGGGVMNDDNKDDGDERKNGFLVPEIGKVRGFSLTHQGSRRGLRRSCNLGRFLAGAHRRICWWWNTWIRGVSGWLGWCRRGRRGSIGWYIRLQWRHRW